MAFRDKMCARRLPRRVYPVLDSKSRRIVPSICKIS